MYSKATLSRSEAAAHARRQLPATLECSISSDFPTLDFVMVVKKTATEEKLTA